MYLLTPALAPPSHVWVIMGQLTACKGSLNTCVMETAGARCLTYEGWGLSHSYIYFFFARLIDHEETWKYRNGSEWC